MSKNNSTDNLSGASHFACLRFVLETRERTTIDALEEVISQQIKPVRSAQLKKLFDGSDADSRRDGDTDLACFWLLVIEGVSASTSTQSPYDLAHHLFISLKLRSCQPDLPLQLSNESLINDTDIAQSSFDRAWHLRAINAKSAWDITGQRGRGIRIANIDTGYLEHVDLDSARLRTDLARDFCSDRSTAKDISNELGFSGHGTAIGSVMMSGGTVVSAPLDREGGTGAPGKITGVAPEAELIPLRVAESATTVFASAIAQAVYYAVACESQIIAITLSSYPMRCLFQAIKRAVNFGSIVLATAGERGAGVGALHWPARYSMVISPLATDQNGELWDETCKSSASNILAPGKGVWHACNTCEGVLAKPGSSNSLAVAVLCGSAALWLGHFGPQKIAEKAKKASNSVQWLFQLSLQALSSHQKKTANEGKEFVMLNIESLLTKLPPIASDPARLLNESFSGRSDLHLLADAVYSALLLRQRSDHMQWHHEILMILSEMELEGHPLASKWQCAEIRYQATNPQLLEEITKRASQTLRSQINASKDGSRPPVSSLD